MWRRSPATRPITPQNIDIESLVSAFTRLRLSSENVVESVQEGPLAHSTGSTYCSYPFVTVTHPAPLPSLVTCLPSCRRARKTHPSRQGTTTDSERWGKRCHSSLSREFASVFRGSKLQSVKAIRTQIPWRMPSCLASNNRPSSLFALSVQ